MTTTQPTEQLPIRIDTVGAVRVVTLNRAEQLNAADRELHRMLPEVFRAIQQDCAARAVVITGAGRAFCAGGDLGLIERMSNDKDLRAEVMAEGKAIVTAMLDTEIPIVAAVNGPAVGLGYSLVTLCDVVVVAASASFADPHVAIGLVGADGGALTLPLSVGLLRAKEQLLLGGRVSAAEAVAMGLATRVVPDDKVVDEALTIAQRLAVMPPQAVVETKWILNAPLRAAVEARLDQALARETESFDTAEFRTTLAKLTARSNDR